MELQEVDNQLNHRKRAYDHDEAKSEVTHHLNMAVARNQQRICLIS
jgi:hypothetical protein